MIALGLSLLALYFILRFVRARIGGVTGDVFGMVVEVTETLTLLTFSV
jgi:cobalamin synthase